MRDPKSMKKDITMTPKWPQNDPKTKPKRVKNEPRGRLVVPLGTKVGFLTFSDFFWCHFGVHFGRFGLHFSIKNRCGNQCKKRCRKSNENGAKNEESLSKSDPKVDQKTKVFLQWWFCEKCCFTVVKPCFLRLQVFKNQGGLCQKPMQKPCLKTVWKKSCKNEAQMSETLVPKWHKIVPKSHPKCFEK